MSAVAFSMRVCLCDVMQFSYANLCSLCAPDTHEGCGDGRQAGRGIVIVVFCCHNKLSLGDTGWRWCACSVRSAVLGCIVF